MNSRMCIPSSLKATSIDAVAERLHAFLCKFHDQWILGNAGSCVLRRNCDEWSDGGGEVEVEKEEMDEDTEIGEGDEEEVEESSKEAVTEKGKKKKIRCKFDD